jgi:hypothetical protein
MFKKAVVMLTNYEVSQWNINVKSANFKVSLLAKLDYSLAKALPYRKYGQNPQIQC